MEDEAVPCIGLDGKAVDKDVEVEDDAEPSDCLVISGGGGSIVEEDDGLV